MVCRNRDARKVTWLTVGVSRSHLKCGRVIRCLCLKIKKKKKKKSTFARETRVIAMSQTSHRKNLTN